MGRGNCMYAHIKIDGDNIISQTVEEHLENTAKIGCQTGKVIGIENMAFLACFFHDMGKNKKEFNNYITDTAIKGIVRKKGEIDHSTAGGQYLYNMLKSDSFANELLAELLTTAVFSHHGLIDIKNEEKGEIFSDRCKKGNIGYEEALQNCDFLFSKYDIDNIKEKAILEMKKTIEKIQCTVTDIYKNTKDKLTSREKKSPYFMIACLQRLITSIVMDADRKDTAEFMTDIPYNAVNDYNSLWDSYTEKLNKKLASFRNINKITELRSRMSDECFEFASNGNGIYCLPIPTGGGKTLASLRFALEHCRLHKKKRIIYTAPYLSILEQNAEEIRNILNDDDNILEHHSNIIIESDEENYDGRNIYRYLTDTWDSPVILTTMVRFLDTLFCYNSSDVRRFCKLCDSVIIIDEIQNIPVEILNLFNITVNFLSRICNATIVLCSATQPLLDKTKSPVIYGSPQNMIKNIDEVSIAFRRTRIIDKTDGGIKKLNTSELADLVLDTVDENILVILNTKGAVAELYNELVSRDTEYDIYQLTTYMCPQHRKDVISYIKKRLDTEKIICISTQLIEAGVDISFNNVIRSLAGLDSIIQAAGRCNRHGGTDIREVYIVDYAEENVSKLKDISKAQAAMRDNVLPYYKKYSNELGDDWLLAKGAERYYETYFFKRKDEMDYQIDGPVNMYNILSEYRGDMLPCIINQYKKAGKSFNPIGSDTVGIIVPYGEGADKLAKFINTNDMYEKKKLLKELQRYTVNVYRTDKRLKELINKNAVILYKDRSIYVLSEGFYDNKSGVKTELEDLIF